jgi:hypothetical protein
MLTTLKNRWLARVGIIVAVATCTMVVYAGSSQAQNYSSSFSYYNPKSGMVYSQGYSQQGRNLSSSWSYGPPVRYGYGPGFGYGYGHTDRGYNQGHNYRPSQRGSSTHSNRRPMPLR